MLFNSVDFWVFFALVVTLHFVLPHAARWVLLLLASYFFYMSWNAAYLLLILLSTAVDYTIGLRMANTAVQTARRRLLVLSLTVNLGLLFVFKYWGFFGANVNAFARGFGLGDVMPGIDLLLPVGISFYTFQTLSYTIDLYRGIIPPERHLGRFALYVAFFPQLVAGPIERARAFLPQIPVVKRFDYDRACSGLQLMLWGLFKKVVIADRLGLYVDAVYGNVGNHTAATFLFATYAFAIQIYCDFSGYSDIAIGAARVLGFDLMKNFSRPYLAGSIVEFWRRWHISLSTWLRDYLYIPLGGNRGTELFTYRNLMITMLLGGLWHGASWSFVLWGFLHGAMLSVSKLTGPAKARAAERLGIPMWVRKPVAIVVTFHLVCLTWVFFRAPIADAWTILSSFAEPWGSPFLAGSTLIYASLGVAVLAGAHLVQERMGSIRDILRGQPLPLRWAVWYALIFAVVLCGVDGGSQFIYFQF